MEMSRLANDVACVLESSFHLLMACVLPELFFAPCGSEKFHSLGGLRMFLLGGRMSVSEFFHIAIIESRLK